MSNSVEIFQNTLLKLVVRSGSDADRQNVVLDVGEIGYTTDTKRLYVGDGVTSGGVLAGNVIIGQAADFATITGSPLAIGDLIYVTGSATLYRYTGGVQTLPSSWAAVGRIYSPENTTLVFTGSGNLVKVGTLSAGNFSNDAVGRNILLDSGRIALSASVAVDKITPLGNTFVELPSSLKIGLSTYQFPVTGEPDTFLKNDGAGNLTWSSAATLLTAASATLIPGKGLTLSVNGEQKTEALLLTSGNVQFDTIFSPTHFVEFNQNGLTARQANITSIEQVDYTALIGLANVPAGSLLDGKTVKLTNDPLRNGQQAASTGAWKITLSTAVNPTSAIVEVRIKNATLRYTPTFRNFLSPDLNSRYFFVGSPTSTELYIYTYASRVTQSDDGGQKNAWNASVLTPGFADSSTRFSVTVYG